MMELDVFLRCYHRGSISGLYAVRQTSPSRSHTLLRECESSPWRTDAHGQTPFTDAYGTGAKLSLLGRSHFPYHSTSVRAFPLARAMLQGLFILCKMIRHVNVTSKIFIWIFNMDFHMDFTWGNACYTKWHSPRKSYTDKLWHSIDATCCFA